MLNFIHTLEPRKAVGEDFRGEILDLLFKDLVVWEKLSVFITSVLICPSQQVTVFIFL